jgi:hypothetical protein
MDTESSVSILAFSSVNLWTQPEKDKAIVEYIKKSVSGRSVAI